MMGLKIMIVDDDPVDRLAIRRALRRRWPEAEIIEARNGGEGLHLSAASPPPAVAVIDVHLKRLMGGDLAWSLRERGIPVVMISGAPEMAPAGFPVVAKAVELGPLVEAIEAALPDA